MFNYNITVYILKYLYLMQTADSLFYEWQPLGKVGCLMNLKDNLINSMGRQKNMADNILQKN